MTLEKYKVQPTQDPKNVTYTRDICSNLSNLNNTSDLQEDHQYLNMLFWFLE